MELLADFKKKATLQKRMTLEEKIYAYEDDINLEWRDMDNF